MDNSPLEILRNVWKYPQFRYPQGEIIAAQLQGHDVLALLPTGAGKSICYQVSALARTGLCLVISPLIALMKDQVEQLRKREIAAAAIYSGLSEYEIDGILNNCAVGHTRILYVSPERLSSERFLVGLKTLPLSMLAVDEAHCISQWGYDFRPSYREIFKIRALFPDLPIIALTASATIEVQQDIANSLGLKKGYQIFTSSFERPNISFVVRKHTSKSDLILNILQKVKGSAIIYTSNRKKTQEISTYLNKQGLASTFYHAGLASDERNKRQEAWISNQNPIICCTNAFGMGIDKPNVRVVIHADVPESLEAYYQEAGRAGRDGKKSYAVLLYNDRDKEKLYQAVNEKFPDFQFVKIVYNAIYNYLNIALGGGKGHSFEFDMVEFSRRYKWEVLKVFNTLKLLEQYGYFSLSEAFFLPSRLQVVKERLELYKFQVANLEFDNLIKTILRSYDGVMTQIVKINELHLAKRAMMSTSDCVKMLRELSKRNVIVYIPSSDKPRISFLEERLPENNLRLDFDQLTFTKNQMKRRIQAMLDYAEADESACRQEIMRAYFGENNTHRCGVCDLCLAQKQYQTTTPEQMRTNLLTWIKSYGAKGIKIDELQLKFGNILKEQYLDLMRILLDEGQLIWVDKTQKYVKVHD